MVSVQFNGLIRRPGFNANLRAAGKRKAAPAETNV
jgi:hypothetical protein